MSVTVNGSIGHSMTWQATPGQTVGEVISHLSPMWDLGSSVIAVSNGVTLSANDQLVDGQAIQLHTQTHSKAS